MATTNPLDIEIPTTKWYRARPSRLVERESPRVRWLSERDNPRAKGPRAPGGERGKYSSAALAAEVATAGGGGVRAAALARLVAALALALFVDLALAVKRLAELSLHVIDVRLVGVPGRGVVRVPGLGVPGLGVPGGSGGQRGGGRLGRVGIGGRGGLGLGRLRRAFLGVLLRALGHEVKLRTPSRPPRNPFRVTGGRASPPLPSRRAGRRPGRGGRRARPRRPGDRASARAGCPRCSPRRRRPR